MLSREAIVIVDLFGMDDKFLGMPQQSFVGVNGPIRSGFLFLLHLAWESRFRLPVLLIVGLMVLDVRMQLEVDFDAELLNDRRQRDNAPDARDDDEREIGDSDDEYDLDDDEDDDDIETGDEDISSISDNYEEQMEGRYSDDRRDRMHQSLPPPFLRPCLLMGCIILAIVAGAQIPDDMLIDDRLVAPPPEEPRQHQASSANREQHHSINSMGENRGEDQIRDGEDDSICFMEIQVTRRIPGRCVSLGRSRGCVAGIYLHPFHHDCF